MYRIIFILLVLVLAPNTVKSESINESEIAIGKSVFFKSEILKEQRKLLIYTPSDYRADKKYQVIYVLDGEFHFIPTVGIVNALVSTGLMPDSIVVAIKTSIRVRDYLPSIVDKPLSSQQKWIQSKFPRFGQANNFIQFIEKELIPFIDKNYSALPNRTLIGHSNAGVFALHTLLTAPSLFTNHLIISPAPWWGDDEINSLFSQLKQRDEKVANNIFLTVATEGNSYYSHASRITANLASSAPKNLHWTFEHLENKTHETTILPSIYKGLSTLYHDFYFKDLEITAKYGQVSSVIDYYENLSNKYKFDVPIPASVLAELANLQLANNREKQAFSTLAFFIKSYPDLPYAHQNLAQGYMRTAQYLLAKKSFEKALLMASKQIDDYTVIDYLKDMIETADSHLNLLK